MHTGFLITLTAWILAFIFSCLLIIKSPLENATFQSRSADSGVFTKMSKTTRAIIAYWCLEKADEYFHNGVPHKQKKAFNDDWYQQLRRNLLSEEHVHISGTRVKEIMPWLWLSAEANPDEVETWLIAAFWLASEVAQPDLAEKVLLSSQQVVGANYKIKLELGRLCLKQNRIKEAERYFDAGLALWPGKYNPEDPETKNDKAKLLVYRAFLYEHSGKPAQAINVLNQALAIFPEREHLRKWIKELETGSATTSGKDIISQMQEVPDHEEDEESHPHGHLHPHSR
jgi:tetratricopeptide (TPR) repeat protein